MAELTVPQKGLVALMAENAQNAAQGFSLLATYEHPEDFFDELEQAGLFSPDLNPAPVPAEDADGGFYLPYWPALGYLINVAKVASTQHDVALGNKLMAIVRAISAYSNSSGRQIDNYYTSSASAEIAGLVPPQCVLLADVEMAAAWLDGGWNNGSIVKELDDGVFTSHLREPTADSIAKLARLLDIVTRLRRAKLGKQDTDEDAEEVFEQKPETVADAYWLDHLLRRHAPALGRLIGQAAVSTLSQRTGEAFGGPGQSELSWLNRAAIEDHEQNHDWDYIRGSLVWATREALQAWLIAEPVPAADFVRWMLRSPHQIVRRLAIHACRLNWPLLEIVFFEELDQGMFQPGHLHELYLLLSERFGTMTEQQSAQILTAISMIGTGDEGEEVEHARHQQRNWLHAVQGKGNARADAAYEAASAGLGPLRDYPDLLSYHQSSWGPGPSPYDTAELVSAASSGILVQLVDGFRTQNHPLRSPRKALLDTVSDAVGQAPREFQRYLSWSEPMSRRLQYALLSGFQNAIKQRYESKREDDVESLIALLLRAHHALLTDLSFWAETAEQNDDFEPNRDWIPPIAVEFVDWLCNKDDLRLESDRKNVCLSILRGTLDHTKGLTDADDALTAAINDPRGKAFGAYLALLLRVCRDADKAGRGHVEEWGELRPVLDSELDRSDSGGLEVHALIGSHIQQLIYVDAEWVRASMARIFPADATKFRAGIVGLGYSRASQALYSMLADAAIPSRVLLSEEIAGSARERMIERVALSYIWGQEPLDGLVIGRIFANEQYEDIRELAHTVARWADEEITPDQRTRALALGARCAEFANRAAGERKALLAVLAEYIAFQVPPEPRDLEWLETAVPYVTEYHGLHSFMESAVRIAEVEPATALRIMRALARGRSPHYDYEGRIERTIRLIASAGFRIEAIRLIDTMSAKGILPSLIPLYEELLAGPTQA